MIRQRNSGQSVARNVGLAACSGEFIILLDADDELLPFDPQLIFDFNVDVLRIAIDDTALDGQAFIDADSVPTLKGNVYLHSRLTGRGFRVESWAYVYRRSYLMARSLRFPVGLIHEDVLFTVEALLYAGSVAGTDVPMYRYIRRPGSTMGTHSYDISRHRLRCFRVIFKSVLGLANTHRDVDLWLWAEHVLNVAWRYACQEKSRRMAWTVLRMEYDFFTGYRLWGVYRTRLQARYRLRQGLEQLLWGPVERHPGREARPSRG